MPNPIPELSSLAATLDEVTRRVTRMAEATATVDDETLSVGLFEIERDLQAASRRLARLLAGLPSSR